MPAFQVAIGQESDIIKCSEIICKMTSQAPIIPKVDRTNGWKEIVSFSLFFLLFFFRPLIHIILAIPEEPNLESFRLAFGALIFLGKENIY